MADLRSDVRIWLRHARLDVTTKIVDSELAGMIEYRCENAQWQHARGSGWSPLHHGGRGAADYPTYLLRRSYRDGGKSTQGNAGESDRRCRRSAIAALKATL